jgi:hypothetical protein
MSVPYSNDRLVVFPITDISQDFEITYQGSIEYLGELKCYVQFDLQNLQNKVRDAFKQSVYRREDEQREFITSNFNALVIFLLVFTFLLVVNVCMWVFTSFPLVRDFFQDHSPSNRTQWFYMLIAPISSLLSLIFLVVITLTALLRFNRNRSKANGVDFCAIENLVEKWIKEMNIKYSTLTSIESFKCKETEVHAPGSVTQSNSRKLQWIEVALKYPSSYGRSREIALPFEVVDDSTPLLVAGEVSRSWYQERKRFFVNEPKSVT